MKNLKGAVNYIKAEEANSKKRLIRNLNKPIVQLLKNYTINTKNKMEISKPNARELE